jgi:ABC-type transporter Mla subunit MlaD
MAIPLPRPGAVVGLTRSALDQALGSAAAFAAVPARAFAVLDEVEALLRRINGLVDRIEGTLDRTDRVLTDAETAVREVAVISTAASTAVGTATEVAAAAAVVVGEAEQVSAAAAVVVGEAERATGTAAELLAAYEPTLRRAAPMAARFVEQLSPEEVTAAIRLVDELPKLKQHLTADVLPILATLDRVGPDLHDLLAVTRDLKLAVAGIPGLGMLRRRGERLTDEPDERDAAVN